MIKVMFVCYGNICRSPMIEFIFKNLVKNKGLKEQFFIASSATTSFNNGMKVDSRTVKKLNDAGIDCSEKTSINLEKEDYDKYDYIVGMDSKNIRDMKSIFGNDVDNKIYKLMYFTGSDEDIADPWYTGNFDITFEQTSKAAEGLFDFIVEKHNLRK